MLQLKPTTGLPASAADRSEDAARYLRDKPGTQSKVVVAP